MSNEIDKKVKVVLDMQAEGKSAELIAEQVGFPSSQALRSFMNRKGYQSKKGVFSLKNEENTNNTEETNNKANNKKEIEIKEKHPNVDKVLDLQIYNMPLFKIASIVEMSESEIEKMMEEQGYIKILDRFVVKPKPTKKAKKAATKTPKKKQKEKTKKQLQEEEFKRNPAKRGKYDPISQVFVINVQLVNIIELQLKKVPLAKIAKEMKLSKPGLIEFMNEHDYVLEDDKFIQRKFAKKIIDTEEFIPEKKELKPRVCDPRIEEVLYTKDTYEDTRKDIQNMYNWYKVIKDHPIFIKK